MSKLHEVIEKISSKKFENLQLSSIHPRWSDEEEANYQELKILADERHEFDVFFEFLPDNRVYVVLDYNDSDTAYIVRTASIEIVTDIYQMMIPLAMKEMSNEQTKSRG